MSDKKYVSLNRLTEYDSLIKQTIADSVGTKADKGHNHNDIYYTESEINTKISTINTSISNITNGTTKVAKAASADSATSASSATKATQDGNGKVISSTYETKSDASAKLAEAKTYADSAATKVKNDLLSNAGSAYDTLKELGDLIDDNTDAISALETVAAGKANASHTHTIANVSGLQSALDGKAVSSHGTHVTYSSTAPVMDGAASVGSASTVARSDHKHPTDTSRAAKTSLDSHTSNTTSHITSTERTNWNAAKTHADSAHAPSNAEKNQNAFSNVKVGSTTVSADSATDTIELVGSNVTITPDATNDKITIAVADATTSAKGVVQLTNSTSSTSTTTAATPNSVKSAYDLANQAKTAAATAQSTADGKANASHTHKVANISDLTATATELNYMDGVTSSVQTQLDGKAASGHTHTIANVTNLQSALDGKSASNHTHNYAGSSKAGGEANALAVFDTRDVNETPTEMTNKIGSRGVRFDFKGTSTVGLNNGTYAAVMSISPWSDVSNWSGGKNTQLGFCDDGKIQVRKGNGSGWTNWNTLIDSSTIGSQSVNYATSAGSATKSTKDASGNTITSTYATKTELDTAKSTLQTSINGKANSSHTHTIANITNLQTTLDGKSNTSHTHKYAGSSSVGGSATSAVKLDTSTAGDANTPVYFSGGKPVACTSLDLNTSGSSASCTGNATTATKLQTARTIGLGTGATGTATSFNGTGNITIPVTDVKESYLSWGGRNLSGSVSPIDAACSNIHSANRFAFAKAAGITIEYSTNGSTYSAYSTTDSAKINLVSGNGNTYYIGARSTSTTVNDKLRITFNATNMGLYTRLRKLLINISTSYATGSNVIIEKAMKGSETTFSTVGTYQISGWSGWNSIPIEAAFGGGSNQTGNIAVLRLTFGITGVNTAQTSNALSVSDIIGIGDTYWSYPSTMAKTGHIYTYDSSQNTTFPANVTATTFVGVLSGNATTATTATKLGSSTVGGATQPVYINNGTATACTYTLGKSVPSNAVFTDTNTKVTNTLATTTKAYVTGTTSASTNTGTQVFDTGVYLDTTAGQLTATTFNGTIFSGSGVATLAEVKAYLGI